MDNKENDTNKEMATVPLAYHEMCMTRNHKTVLRLLVCWAVTVVLIVGAFVWLWCQYDYVSTVDNTGVYVVEDANGNVIASDLSPDDVIRIMQELTNGENTENQG